MSVTDDKAKELANWIRNLEKQEANQAAELKETRDQIKDAKNQLVTLFADEDRPLLEDSEEDEDELTRIRGPRGGSLRK